MRTASKYPLFALLSLASAFFLLGCASLEKGGAYAPVGQQEDKALYLADVTYKMAYTSLDAAFKFEKDNRDALWKLNPNIKHTLDKVRTEAWQVHQQWAQTRSVYLANPVPDNLDALQTVASQLQRLVATAQAALVATKKGN